MLPCKEKYSRIISYVLKMLIIVSLFLSLYVYFCGPIILHGKIEFRIRHYEPFLSVFLIIWMFHLLYVSFRKNLQEESINYFKHIADGFYKNLLLGSFLLVFLSSIIMHKDIFIKPVTSRYLLLDDSLMTLKPLLDFLISKLSVVILIYAVSKLMVKLVDKESALFSALIIASFQFTNNNCGAFAIENIYFALSATALYILLYCEEGTAIWGFPLLAVIFILHPAGYSLILLFAVFFAFGGATVSFNLKNFVILTGFAIMISVAWYISIRNPLLHFGRSGRNWSGYSFSIFYTLLKKTVDNRLILFLAFVGIIRTITGIFSRKKCQRRFITISIALPIFTALWWYIERKTFSLNSIAIVMPVILMLNGIALSCLTQAHFLTKTLFDRNITAIVFLLIIAFIFTNYKFNSSILSSDRYSVFEMYSQTNKGAIVVDEDAESGYSQYFAKNKPEIVIFRTHNYLLAGEYELRVKLKAKDCDSESDLCQPCKIGVGLDDKNETLHELVIVTHEQLQGKYNEFILQFSINKISKIHFKLKTFGTADISLDHLRIIKQKQSAVKN